MDSILAWMEWNSTGVHLAPQNGVRSKAQEPFGCGFPIYYFQITDDRGQLQPGDQRTPVSPGLGTRQLDTAPICSRAC